MVLTLHSKRRTLMFRPCFLRLLRPLLPDMTWEMADRSSVYLTFDDGPTPGITEWILKTLAGYGVRAPFFGYYFGSFYETFVRRYGKSSFTHYFFSFETDMILPFPNGKADGYKLSNSTCFIYGVKTSIFSPFTDTLS